MKRRSLDIIEDTRARAVLHHLHAEADAQMRQLILHYLPKIPRMITGRKLTFGHFDGFYKDKYLSLEVDQAAFIYTLALSSSARYIIEFGTSFGISTIWLALAARASGGKVVTTEIVSEKADRASANIQRAGLADHVEIRVGDATQTLRDLDHPVDFMLNDGFPNKALEVLQLIRPRLAKGAPVVTDNIATFRGNFVDYLAWVRDPANGFVSTTVPFKSGTEVSVSVR